MQVLEAKSDRMTPVGGRCIVFSSFVKSLQQLQRTCLFYLKENKDYNAIFKLLINWNHASAVNNKAVFIGIWCVFCLVCLKSKSKYVVPEKCQYFLSLSHYNQTIWLSVNMMKYLCSYPSLKCKMPRRTNACI